MSLWHFYLECNHTKWHGCKLDCIIDIINEVLVDDKVLNVLNLVATRFFFFETLLVFSQSSERCKVKSLPNDGDLTDLQNLSSISLCLPNFICFLISNYIWAFLFPKMQNKLSKLDSLEFSTAVGQFLYEITFFYSQVVLQHFKCWNFESLFLWTLSHKVL